ncbi:hypothetical protein V6N12_021264 [Hibiscus sabdariffa]|uniref:RRM domain-containing protein n=1 Tax=Hibiscus sabdariffa TaxID=183260 RepID=A0ABR2FR46_9ROSI
MMEIRKGSARGYRVSGRFSQSANGKHVSEWTVFVDNLSRRVSRGAIWELFSHYGKVSQVFISMANKKPRYQFSTFAFVRFVSGKSMELAIEKMNNAKIDGRIITVSKARFPMSYNKMNNFNDSVYRSVEKNRADQGSFGKINKGQVGFDSQSRNKGVQNHKDSVALDSRTFKDVLLGKPKIGVTRESKEDSRIHLVERVGSKSLFDIHIPVKDTIWIDMSLAGVMKQSFDLDFIQKALLSDGINAKVASWGNSPLSCIITFKSASDRDDAWSKREEGLLYWFDYLEPLVNEKGVPASFIFVSLIGVPLQCWHESFFVNLGNRWGSFIAIDQATKNASDFSSAKMIIRAESPFDIPNVIKVRSMGRIFAIKVNFENQLNFQSNENLGGEEVHFADVWPGHVADGENEKEGLDSLSQSSSPDLEVPAAIDRSVPMGDISHNVGLIPNLSHSIKSDTRFPRNVDNVVVHDPDNNHLSTAGRSVAAAVGINCDVAWASLNNSSCQARVGDLSDLGLIAAAKICCGVISTNSIDGPINLVAANSSEPNDALHCSPSFEMVPDSFEGLDNSLALKIGQDNQSKMGQSPRALSSLHAGMNERLQCYGDLDFFNPIHRKEIRSTIRDSLEDAEVPAVARNSASMEGEDNNINEANAVWEVSQILGIAFKGGKDLFLKRVRELEDELRKKESKIDDPKPSFWRKIWNNPNMKSVFSPSVGSAGGLISMWNGDVFIASSHIITQRFIAITGFLKDLNFECGFLNIYAPTADAEKRQFFSEISEFLSNSSLPWSSGFTIKSGAFTWSNLRDPPTLIRLDRFLVSLEFLSTFQSMEQHLLHKSISDHNAIALKNEVCHWGSRPFKFFNYLLDENGFVDMVISNLQGATGGRKKVRALKMLKGAKVAIKEWSDKNYNFSGKNIEALQKEIKELESLQAQGMGDANSHKEIVDLRGKLWKELRIEERAWLQKSRTRIALWFKAKFPDSLCFVDDLIADPSVGDGLSASKIRFSKQQVWEAPPIGFLKLNVDGAMVSNGSKGGIGGIVRNNLGVCLVTFSLPIGPGPPIMAELEAIFHGLSVFSSNHGFKKFRLILETDCSVAFEWISNSTPCPTAFEPLVRRCRDIIASFSVVFRHVPREINMAADSLAKEGIG